MTPATPVKEPPMPDRPTTSDVRQTLIAESIDFNERRQTHRQAMHNDVVTFAHCDAYEGLARAEAYGLLLAAFLGELDKIPGYSDIAADFAAVVAEVMANGDGSLANANADLSKPATASGGAR